MLSLDEQLAYWHAHKERAFERTLQLMVDNREFILAKGEQRLIAGVWDFGDASWHKAVGQLIEEAFQELADAPIYVTMAMRQEEVGATETTDSRAEYALAGGPDD